MEVLAVYNELKLHGMVAKAHFDQALEKSNAACLTYGNQADVVVCLQKGGESIHKLAAKYLERNLALANKLHGCLKINQDKESVAWKSCIADVKTQVPKLSFKE